MAAPASELRRTFEKYSIYLPPAIWAEIDALASEKGATRVAVVRELVLIGLRQLGRKVAV